MEKGITKRQEDYSQWYLDVIEAAQLAEHAPVKGCMTIKPYGYAIWENIQKILDREIKEKGGQNAYFPLFIPKEFLEREAKHMKGFAPECVVATQVGNKKLPEPLIIRPTSETIIYEAFSRWIKSWRDLPLIINQWANVVRWELRPRLFLRTTEFLWQEGHSAHATENEADITAKEILEVYKKFIQDFLAIPVVTGHKTESEKFPGAVFTYTLEAMMQDGKALQLGTSHLLGQNFAKPFKAMFLDKQGRKRYIWQTSWGVSTRLIGGLIMAHSDDKGLVLPPKIAPLTAVIIPVFSKPEERKKVEAKARALAAILLKQGIGAQTDTREQLTFGAKHFEWEKKGVPLRLELGPKEIARQEVVIVRRDTSEKELVKDDKIISRGQAILESIQKSLFERALSFQKKNTYTIENFGQFKRIMKDRPGFVYAPWCLSPVCEEGVKKETKATIRVIPFIQKKQKGKCIFCGKPSRVGVLFAKAY